MRKKQQMKTTEEFSKELYDVNPDIVLIGEYMGAKNKIKCRCNICNYEWASIPDNVLRSGRCKNCNQLAKEQKLKNRIKLERPDVDVIGEYTYSTKPTTIRYTECNHIVSQSINNILNSHVKCPYCYGNSVLKGYNDFNTTHTHLSMYLDEINEGYLYSHGSTKKVMCKCPNCGNKKEYSFHTLSNRGFYCNVCSDKTSYPEKFMMGILNQLNVEYIHDKTLDWSQNKRYDFYIKSLSLIIETHGEQHYSDRRSKKGYKNFRSFEEEKQNDKYKKELAIANGVKHYIELDCRKSDFDYIKQSILNSKLSDIFDLSDINWQLCDNYNQETFNKVLELWNSGFDTANAIGEKLGMKSTTIGKYLKSAKLLGLCNYDSVLESKVNTPKKLKKILSKKIICLETGEIYSSLMDIQRNLGYFASAISACCRKITHTSYGYHWMFYDEYIKK